jgi:hypothetical protein
LLRRRQVVGRDANDRRRGRVLDDPGLLGHAGFERGARLERGTPEIPRGHACCDEQAKPQRIE